MLGGVVIMPVTGFSVTEQAERQTNPVTKASFRIDLDKAFSRAEPRMARQPSIQIEQ